MASAFASLLHIVKLYVPFHSRCLLRKPVWLSSVAITLQLFVQTAQCFRCLGSQGWPGQIAIVYLHEPAASLQHTLVKS